MATVFEQFTRRSQDTEISGYMWFKSPPSQKPKVGAVGIVHTVDSLLNQAAVHIPYKE